jgi:hypothetical protein
MAEFKVQLAKNTDKEYTLKVMVIESPTAADAVEQAFEQFNPEEYDLEDIVRI